jgi:hypothetical protein
MYYCTDASLQFGLQPAVGESIQQQLQQVQQQLGLVLEFQRHLGASIANTRIFSRNRRNVHVLTPLQKYVSFSSHYAIHAELKFDSPRLKVTAMIWHSPFVAMSLSPSPLKLTNRIQPLVMCPINGSQGYMHIPTWTYSV